MESPEDLSRAIELYELQLNEVRQALERATPAERPELETLEANVLELLELTRQNLNATLILRHSNGSHVTTKQSDQPQDSALDSEYALFKAELAELETSEGEVGECSESPGPLTTSDDTDAADIQEELDELVGSKCQAPYTNKVQATDYYNALVLSTHVPHSASDLQHIQVRVMFTNPIEREMIPCPFYLDGDCKFSDDKCNFSHGYLVPLSKLREYREPDFSRVRAGCEVLAKPPGSDLWVWTRVEDILSLDTVSVRHEGSSVHVPLQNILPLLASTNQDEDWNERLEDSGTEEEDRTTESGETPWSEAAVERSLLDQVASSKARLGQWEQHTKGIGSKLLARMGYVVGAGLGRRGEGILEPVEAVVLPPGKSLDHCMKLREEAGGSKNLFSVERIQKKLAAKAQRRSAQIYRNKKQQDQNNVFTIINSMTSQSKQEEEGEELSSSRFKKRLESSSERWLNVEKVKTEETMERTARDVRELGEKLSLKPCGSVEYRNIASRLQTAKARLETLQKKNVKIAWEINTRETKKKMAF